MNNRHAAVRCIYCNKVMKSFDVEVLFYKPVDRAFGLHKKCERAYNTEAAYNTEVVHNDRINFAVHPDRRRTPFKSGGRDE